MQLATSRSYNPTEAGTSVVWALPRSLATTGGIIRLFSLPAGTKMFQFPAFASSLKRITVLQMLGCPIRKSTDQRPFAPPRGLSQLVTSFIACESLGIHHTPFSTFYHSGVNSPKRDDTGSLILSAVSSRIRNQFLLRSYLFFAFASNMSKIACRPRCLGGCAEHQGNDPRTGLLPLSLPAPCAGLRYIWFP